MGFCSEFYWNWIVKMNKSNSNSFIQFNSSELNCFTARIYLKNLEMNKKLNNSIEFNQNFEISSWKKWINPIQSDLFNSIQVNRLVLPPESVGKTLKWVKNWIIQLNLIRILRFLV